jgi:hypothetical protein
LMLFIGFYIMCCIHVWCIWVDSFFASCTCYSSCIYVGFYTCWYIT